MRTFALALVALSLPLAAGCGHASLTPLAMTVETPQAARIDVKRIHKGIIELAVYNLSPSLLVIDRNGVLLQTPTGMIQRIPGGWGDIYNVPPGGVHGLNVRFNLGDLPSGTQVQLVFPTAIQINGMPVGMPPIPLAVE